MEGDLLSSSDQVLVRLQLKFNSLEFDSELGTLVIPDNFNEENFSHIDFLFPNYQIC